MKLWQKVFIASLIIVILSVDISAIFVLQTSFKTTIEQQRAQAVTQQEYLVAEFSSNIVNERLKTGQILLSDEALEPLLSGIIKGHDFQEIALYNKKQKLVAGNSSDVLTKQTDFMTQVKKSHAYLTYIIQDGTKTYLLTGSALNLENQSYTLYTTTDLTWLYDQYDHQLFIVQMMSMTFALILSLILLVIILNLLNPLKKLNASILDIAQGNYKRRLKVQGSREFQELASNVNIMTKAIEDNAQRIQAIADGRKDFINHFAHEMKTPLTSIMGFADLLRIQRVVNDTQRQEYANIIFDEAKRLKSLSSKLLEIATTDHALLEFETISLNELFEEIRVAFLPILEKKNIQLSVISQPITIQADRQLFKSLLYNLVDNAVKASLENGTIELTSQLDQDHLTIEVCDHGIGISEDDLKKITEPFYMVDKSRSRKSGGAGLGLSLCDQIAKRHQAKMIITSKLGTGTKVQIIMKGEAA